MKHSIEVYENCNHYGSSGDEIQYSCKVIKVRKRHYCIESDEENHFIEPGQMALVEVALIPGVDCQSAYTCLPCLDDWIDHIKAIEELSKCKP